MFDFFRDMILEASGIDSKAAAEERKERKEAAKKERFIFSKGAKVIVYVMGAIYLAVAWIGMAAMIQAGTMDAFRIIRFIFLVGCDIASIICLAIGKKKTEIAALILIILFVVSQYFSTLFM